MTDAHEQKKARDRAHHATPKYRKRKNARFKKYYAKNREACLARKRAYLKANPDQQEKMRLRAQRYYVAHKSTIRLKQRVRQLQRNYGLSVEAFYSLLAGQGGVCATCRTPLAGGSDTHIDHDHVTGSVRGVLCLQCNLALGLVRESSTTLSRMVDYLGGFEK